MAKSNIQNKDYCFACGKGGALEAHHVFEGTANRKKSDEDGMVIFLHHSCHMWIHEHPKTMLTFKKRAQRKWEELYGTRKEFIKRYGRNYLDD